MPSIMRLVKFRDIDIDDEFFDSLKSDYKEFSDWFKRKANEYAYVITEVDGTIEAFLYLKLEDGVVSDVNPPLPAARRVKVGTFKINPHGTKLGERFVKKAFDYAVSQGVEEIYVTVFADHEPLIRIFNRYGFVQVAEKPSQNGVELVLAKKIHDIKNDVVLDYPLIKIQGAGKFLLAIHPEFHTRLLPDSILNNESFDVVKDVSHTNSIHKIYISFMNLSVLKRGDALITYRTSDQQGAARFRSVVTSVGIVESVKSRADFANVGQFIRYCEPHSVFTSKELTEWWNGRRNHLYAVKFTYNAAFQRRITRGSLIDDIGLDENERWSFMRLTDAQFRSILQAGGVNESIIVY